MFLCAKSASAATAALGFSGYLLAGLGEQDSRWLVPLALVAVVAMTTLILGGARRGVFTNVAIVSITIAALVLFVLVGLPTALHTGVGYFKPFFTSGESSTPTGGFLEACALMFVAYTGYGRIATLGEEIKDPRRNIPRAIICTLATSLALYMAVGFVAISTIGADALATAVQQQSAPLEIAARKFGDGVAAIVSLAAITSMLGVLLNLILGLSRVALAMGRRGDLPPQLATIDVAGSTPYVSVFLVGGVIATLALIGDVKTTWSFSAFTVLVYYALTNLAALRLSSSERLYPRFIPCVGLLSCLFLAFWVKPTVWMVGLGLIAVGLLWLQIARRLFPRTRRE
jgi:APA family basic amino acid/polyamine antiporter